MSLRSKIFLLSGGTVAVLLCIVFLLVRHRVRVTAVAEARAELTAAAGAIDRITDEGLQSKLGQARFLARVPWVIAALENEVTDLSRLPETAVLRMQGVCDLVLLADSDARLLAATAEAVPGEMLRAAEGQPLREALDDGAAAAVWALGGALYSVAAARVEEPETRELLGVIAIGSRLEDVEASRLRSLTQSDLVIFVGGAAVDSSLSEPKNRQLKEAYGELVDGGIGERKLADEPYLVRVKRVPVAYGGPVDAVLVRSLGASKRLAKAIRADLGVIGGSMVLVALLAGWLGARALTEPLRRLGRAMTSMTRSGEARPDFESVGGGREVELFEDSFRHLIASLEQSHQERESSYVDAVGALVAAIDARDKETQGHSFRVARYAVCLGRRIGLSTEEVRILQWGALLHDVGKIAVPDAVLRKNGPLSPKEWEVMRQHPAWGAKILGDVGFLRSALEIVENHQERWDGSGYPRGLSGKKIPLGARIFAVVDTYDSITSDRTYRRAASHQQAVAELQRVAGSQLDPQIVEIFLTLDESELRQLRRVTPPGQLELGAPLDLLATVAAPEVG